MRKYSHVIVIGIDGAGAYIKDAITPNFDKIFKDGAKTFDALASNPTISAECWGSMLLGVGPEVHKLTNGIVSNNPYPTDSAFPSVFRRIRDIYPNAVLGSYCDWNPITYGIIENGIGVSHDTAKDFQLTPIICDYIRETHPDFLFIQFDSVDGAGHRNGYGTAAHLESITHADKLVGDIYNTAKEALDMEETLFMVIADHGGANNENGGGSHGGWTDSEKYVTFAAVGKNVKSGNIGTMNIRDLAAIVLYAFGIEPPKFDENGWTAQIPEGIFTDDSLPEYKDISHLTGAAPRISKTPHTSELV
ncbi:MAG: alkaline phosphatase family protein [Clostridia bacterium]|nr:alkaline phosphatase family protein [Clostridia bacterium]